MKRTLDRKFRRRKATIATKNQTGARSGTLSKGEITTGGHLHHPDGLNDAEGVVHPRG